MYTQQLYTNCLAQGAYYIESDGEAAVIDPMRDVQSYIDLAKSRGARIRYVFETHFHADFVSGHVDLAEKTGAQIVYGPTSMQTGFAMLSGHDGQEFPLGKAKIRLIHTPGHTPESACFLLIDEQGRETALFSGDTLFLGDVGRPDLAQKVVAELTQEKLASMLYDSIHNKILPLSDDLIVYPGHGAGSACGKKLSNESSDTLGHQKRSNYALNPKLTREEFVEQVLEGLTPPPGYFPQNVLLNIGGYDRFDELMKRSMRPLSAIAFQAVSEEDDVIILDTRDAHSFSRAFVPGSINIGLNGSYAVWAGTLLTDLHQKLLIVADDGKEEESVRRLARVGFDQVIGYLQGGFDVWKDEHFPTDHIRSYSVDEFAEHYLHGEGSVLDVRKKTEYDSEHIVGAKNIPLDYITDRLSEVDKEKKVYVHCAAGYRSMIFVSYLRRLGYQNLIDIAGGFNALKASGRFPVSEFKEQTSEL